MKNLRLCLLLFSFMGSLFAAPDQINYQGRLADNGGNPVSGNVNFDVSIFNVPAGGVPLFTEGLGFLPVVNGLYSFQFGNNPSAGDLGTALSQVNAYLEVTVNGVALTPRQKLVAVPYTMRALSADSVVGGVDDADADPNNEKISAVNLAGNNLNITEGGVLHSVNLASLADNDSWIYLNGSGTIGHLQRSGKTTIGAHQRLDEQNVRLWAQNYTSGYGAVKGVNRSSSANAYSEGSLGVLNLDNDLGLPIDVHNLGVYGFAPPQGQDAAAVYGWNNDIRPTNYGGVFVADGNGGSNYAVYGLAENGTNNYAGYFDGDVLSTGILDMSSQRIIAVANPAFASDAATKGYVDNAISGPIGTVTTGYVPYWNGSSFANSNLYRGNSTVTGINETSPDADLHIKQSSGNQSGTGGVLFEVAGVGADTWKLYHSGTHFSFSENGLRTAYVQGGGTGAFISLSDRRAKRDIEDMPPMLDRVNKLKPSRYSFKQQKPDATPELGLIAQEVKEHIPEVVSEDEEGMLGISYGQLSVVAIKAIQEQQGEIREQQKEIDVLRKEIEELKALIQKGR